MLKQVKVFVPVSIYLEVTSLLPTSLSGLCSLLIVSVSKYNAG